MALTIKEQLDILVGSVRPEFYPFTDYIDQVVINLAQDFYNNVKDTTDNTLARQYFIKVGKLYKEIINNPANYSKRLAKMLIAIYADTGNIATVQNATDDQWVGFIEANLLETVEKLSGVLPTEKTAYNIL
jgi:hypothetical protein